MLAQYKALALAGLVSLGCGADEGRFDEIRIYYSRLLEQSPQETVDEAEEILGLAINVHHESDREVRAGSGSIGVLTWATLPNGGQIFASDRCARAVWVNGNGQALAHELGHALALQHVDDPANLMGPSNGTDLTDEQIDRTRLEAWRLEQCR